MKTKLIFREPEAIRLRADLKVSTGRLKGYISGLEEKSFPVYWDLLYRIFVLGEGNPIREYRYRLADSIPSTLDRLDAANAYARLLPRHNVERYNAIPAVCVDVAPDGSFKVNESKLEAYVTEHCTYELSEEDLKGIEAYNKAFASSSIAPHAMVSCARPVDGRIQINESMYIEALGKRSLADCKARARKASK